jgi:PiT family inorganic phosphate transporter
LNRNVTPHQTQDFLAVSAVTVEALGRYSSSDATPEDPRAELSRYLRTRETSPATLPAAGRLASDLARDLAIYKELKNVPADQTRNFRNDMYLVSEALRLVQKTKTPAMSAADAETVANYRKHLDDATKFIPTWVKIAVAIALGLGTMVGWKRIVVTVGEKIGKDHLTYAQGAAAEITAMATIGAADAFGLPVSTTHVLSSGVAGTMAANRSGLQWSTVRNLALAWVLTLPASIVLAGTLFWLFSKLT